MNGKSRAYAALGVLAGVWGYNWVAIKIATHNADALSLAAVRSIVGTLCLFLALVVTRQPLRPPPLGSTLLLGLLQTTLFTLLSVLGVAAGGAGKTAILVYTMPFWIVLIAWPVLHERVSPGGWFALALAAIGLACVAAPLDLTRGSAATFCAVGSAIVWAASAVYGKVLRARRPWNLLGLTAWQMLYGTLPLVAIAMFGPRHIVITPSFVAAVGYVAIAGTALAWLLWMFILSRLPAGVTGIASLLTPVVGVLAAWAQLGERPGLLELSGLGCIVAALVINLLRAAHH